MNDRNHDSKNIENIINLINNIEDDRLAKELDEVDASVKLIAPRAGGDVEAFLVRAESLESGLRQGAEHFELNEDDLDYQIIEEPGAAGKEKAAAEYLLMVYPKVLAGEIEIEIDKNELVATIPMLYPLNRDGEKYELSHILNLIGRAGINYGIVQEGLSEAYSKCQARRTCLEKVVAARGKPPERSTPESYVLTVLEEIPEEKRFQFEAPFDNGLRLRKAFSASSAEELLADAPEALLVQRNKIIARWRAGNPGVPGCSVLGKEIKPEDDGGPSLQAGDNVRVSDSANLTASSTGYLLVDSRKISVQPPIWISPDRITADFIWLDPIGKPTTPGEGEIRAILKEAGVVFGISDSAVKELQQRLSGAARGKFSHVLARGRPPKPGLDATVEYHFDRNVLPGQIGPDGKIDYRERNYVQMVKKGSVIAGKMPSMPAEDGLDVTGKIVSARNGRDVEIKDGTNVSTVKADNGEIRYQADITGRVSLVGGILSVTKTLEIGKDIDFSTGNIRFDGDVVISGSVKPGFNVVCNGDVVVKGYIEAGGQVQARGNLMVGQGILGHETRAKAGGSIQARFIENARVEAGGDIEIGSHCVGATVRSGGTARILGKGFSKKDRGAVLGGSIMASDRIEARSVGSDYNASTELIAGIDPAVEDQLQKIQDAMKQCEMNSKRLMRTLGEGFFQIADFSQLLKRTSAKKRQVIVGYLSKLKELTALREDLLKLEAKVRNKAEGHSLKSRIAVAETLHTDVSVRIGKYKFHSYEPRKKITLRIDAEENKIVGDTVRGGPDGSR